MKLLVVTSEPISAQQLRSAVDADLSTEDAEVMVVAPALQENALHFWLSDADQAIAKAEQVRQASLRQLDSEGVAATGDTGESDPLEAIQDALTTFPADRVVLFTHTGGGQRYREDIDPEEIAEQFGLPVDHAELNGQ